MFKTEEVKITRVSNAAAAAQTAINSSVLDMAGFDGVMFVALLGDSSSGSVITLTANENTANSTSAPMPTTSGISATYTDPDGASADNNVLVVDVQRPSERYVFANLTRTTANCAVDGIIAIQYQSHSKPTAQSAGVLAKGAGLGA